MTWQKSFFKLTLHDIKKRSWCMAIFFVAQFFALPIMALLTSQQTFGYDGEETGTFAQYPSELANLFERNIFDIGSKISPILLIAGAIIMAMSGFSYLNSKRRVDFIHSMPVKRETLFLSRYTAGFFLYMLPLVVNVGIALIFSVTLKAYSIYVLKSALYFLLYQMIYFLLFYSTAILAVVLIGNFAVSFLGIGILFSYQTIFWFILVNLKVNFFQTYMRDYQNFRVYDPIGLLIRQIMSLNQNYLTWGHNGNGTLARVGEAGYYSTGGEVCLIALFVAIVTGALALLAFRLRKSEAAGKTLAFPKLEPFAKAALLLPAGLIGGLVMYGAASGYRRLWYIFGAVVVFLLVAAAVEIIFRQDFKSLLKHKISAAVGAGLILLVTLCFWLDLMGYDSWVPKVSQIESVGVSIPDVEDQRNFYTSGEKIADIEYYGYDYSIRFFFHLFNQYMGTEEVQTANPVLYHCEITGGEEIEKVRALADYFVEHKEELKKVDLTEFYDEERQWVKIELSGEETDGDAPAQYLECQVVYRLKNGKSVYRSYWMPYGEEFLEVMEPVFANADYKKAAFPVFMDDTNYSLLDTCGIFVNEYKQIARSDKKELMECYWKDREKLTFRTTWEENVSAYFTMSNTLGSKVSVACKVYESDVNTLNWLKEHEITFEVELDELEVLSGMFYYKARDGQYVEEDLKSDQEKKDILPYLIHYEFIPLQQKIYLESKISVMLEYSIKQEKESNVTWNGDYQEGLGEAKVDVRGNIFLLKEIPPFIKDKLQ